MWSGREKAGRVATPHPHTIYVLYILYVLHHLVTTKLLHVYYTLSSFVTQKYANVDKKMARLYTTFVAKSALLGGVLTQKMRSKRATLIILYVVGDKKAAITPPQMYSVRSYQPP